MLLDAPFVAVIQIIVYAGAIMVLFLFVVMLLNAPQEDTETTTRGVRVARCGAGPMRFGALLAVALVVGAGLGADAEPRRVRGVRRRRGQLGRRDRPLAVHRLRVSRSK